MVWYAEQNNQIEPAGGNSGAIPFCVPTPTGFLFGDTMKKIPLTQGKAALVDDADYEWLNQWKWCAVKMCHFYYAVRHAKQDNARVLYMHREIMSAPKGLDIDHIDHDGLNNQKINMRLCTRQQNCANKRKRDFTTSSKYKGVCYIRKNGLWLANISYNNKTMSLGHHAAEEDAARAYDKKAVELFGEFASTNF